MDESCIRHTRVSEHFCDVTVFSGWRPHLNVYMHHDESCPFYVNDIVADLPVTDLKLISFRTLVGIDASLRRDDGTILSISTSMFFGGVNFP